MSSGREPWPPKMDASVEDRGSPGGPATPANSRYATHRVKAGIVHLALERGASGSGGGGGETN